MKTKISTLVVISLLILAVFSFYQIQPANATNWLTGWNYRKSHVVVHSSGAGTNYQIQIVVKNSSSADSGDTVNIDASGSSSGKLRSDFGDVRFTSDDGSTLLYAWNETFYSGANVTVRVKVTADLSVDDQTIYIYYGKSDASYYWDGPNTFLFFDDFLGTSINNTQWKSLTYTPTTSVSGSILSLTGTHTDSWNQGYMSNVSGGKVQYVRWESNCSMPFSNLWMTGLASMYDTNDATNNVTTFYTSTQTRPYVRNLSSTYTTTVAFTAPAFSIKQFTWNSSVVALWDNAATTSLVNVTSAVPKDCYMNVSMLVFGTPGNPFKADWVFLSKFSYPEPSHGSWGTEETLCLNLLIQDSSGNPISGAVVEFVNGGDVNVTSSPTGWANLTGILLNTNVTVKVAYQDTWVNGTFTVNVTTTNKNVNVTCKVYSLTIYLQTSSDSPIPYSPITGATLILARNDLVNLTSYGLTPHLTTTHNLTHAAYTWNQLANQTYQITANIVSAGGPKSSIVDLQASNSTLIQLVYPVGSIGPGPGPGPITPETPENQTISPVQKIIAPAITLANLLNNNKWSIILIVGVCLIFVVPFAAIQEKKGKKKKNPFRKQE